MIVKVKSENWGKTENLFTTPTGNSIWLDLISSENILDIVRQVSRHKVSVLSFPHQVLAFLSYDETPLHTRKAFLLKALPSPLPTKAFELSQIISASIKYTLQSIAPDTS